jgi:hypothetical protein
MAGKLILTRKESFVNRRQRYKVLIDGVEAGQVKNGDTEEFTLPPGTHTLQCKINWMSSRVETFELNEGNNTYLVVSNGMRFFLPFYILLLVGVFIPFYFHLIKSPVPPFINTFKIVLILPTLIYLLLYMTVLRNKYLLIGEDKSNPFK